jgi:hypothetical protein
MKSFLITLLDEQNEFVFIKRLDIDMTKVNEKNRLDDIISSEVVKRKPPFHDEIKYYELDKNGTKTLYTNTIKYSTTEDVVPKNQKSNRSYKYNNSGRI